MFINVQFCPFSDLLRLDSFVDEASLSFVFPKFVVSLFLIILYIAYPFGCVTQSHTHCDYHHTVIHTTLVVPMSLPRQASFNSSTFLHFHVKLLTSICFKLWTYFSYPMCMIFAQAVFAFSCIIARALKYVVNDT